MKSLFSLASLLIFSAMPALAAEGQVSHQSLANMGLTGMKAMNDVQGMEVRGLSIAVVGGHSSANVNLGYGNNANSSNFYFAAGKHSASGANLSGAAVISVETKGNHVSTNTTIIAAGGFSTAKSH